MDIAILGATFLLAVVDWVAAGYNWGRLRYVTKPAALLVLTIWFVRVTDLQGPGLWFGLGLVFSLIGDICLMIPRNWFLAGLLSFLVTHILYIISLHPTPPPLPPVAWTLVVVIAAWALVFYRIIRGGLARVPGNRRLRIGAGVYSLVITLMLLSTVLTLFRPDWSLSDSILVIVGGLLFFVSDSLLAYDRFIRTFRYGRVLVMVTYHLGQIALAAGMALHLRQAL